MGRKDLEGQAEEKSAPEFLAFQCRLAFDPSSGWEEAAHPQDGIARGRFGAEPCWCGTRNVAHHWVLQGLGR